MTLVYTEEEREDQEGKTSRGGGRHDREQDARNVDASIHGAGLQLKNN